MNIAGGTDAKSLRVESDTTATAAFVVGSLPPSPEGDVGVVVAQPKLLLTANFHLSSLKVVEDLKLKKITTCDEAILYGASCL